MTKSLLAAGAFLVLLSGIAPAEEAVMLEPIQAASLHQGPLDMVAFWQHLDDGGFELTATFRAREPEAQPMRVVMKLEEGDSVRFAMPGYASALYTFERTDARVTAAVELLSRRVAAN